MNRTVDRVFRSCLLVVTVALLGGTLVLAVPNSGVDAQADGQPVVALDLVVGGLAEPIYVTGLDDGSGRLFVVEKAGTIRIVENGVLLDEPFLDISERVETEGLERGMLGLVFHPDFARNGRLFVTHVPIDGAWSLEEYRVSEDRNRVDHDSVRQLIYLSKENHYAGHYGGMLAFGPDGYLYASIGDGGGAFDPFSHAQNLGTLPGSILRLDVDSGDPYAIPEDNPFVGVEGARPEIWLYGLRNPWRFSFDRDTGELYIGDVGHVEYEEVDYVPADATGGTNFGWPLVEGPICSEIEPDCDLSQFEPPVYTYTHREGCTVIGGYSYRWHPASQLYGHYIFGDYCDGTIWSLERDDEGQWQHEILLDTDFNISSFGEGATGRLYLTDITGGSIYELVDPGLSEVPAIDRLSQSLIVVGGVACQLEIYGANFREDAVVLWNGEERPSQWIHSQTLRVGIDGDDTLGEGPVRLSVRQDGPEAVISNAVGLEIVDGPLAANAIANTWARYDQPIAAGQTVRTWTLGPDGMGCATLEPYTSAPDGLRVVQYFDKGRLEITNPDGDQSATWYVTSGLLATEMLTGRVQRGDSEFDQLAPAEVNIAGDAVEANGPSYAVLGQRLDDAPQAVDTLLDLRIGATGEVSQDPSMGEYDVRSAIVDDLTNHAIAEPFWDFMNSSGLIWDGMEYVDGPLFQHPYYVIGRPVSEAYWAEVAVGGRQLDVLLQCFERRCLTYTPDNPTGWQVEAGNTGLHYVRWRYE